MGQAENASLVCSLLNVSQNSCFCSCVLHNCIVIVFSEMKN